MIDMACDLRIIEGPSLQGEAAVIVLRFPIDAGAPRPTMDADEVARWRAICRRSGLPLPEKPYEGIAASGMVAVTLGHLAGLLSGRGPEPLRRRRGRDGSEEILVSGLPPRLAHRALDIAQRVVALARDPTAVEDGIVEATAALRREPASDIAAASSDPSTAALIRASERAGIPWRASHLHPGSLLLGEGRFQARFNGTGSLSRPALGMLISRDKIVTKRYLAGLGLPVAPARVVASPDEAAAAGEALGFPVVVKPTDGTFSRGVTLDVRTGTEARVAYARAAERGSGVLVEPFFDVPDYRAMVVAGESIIVHRRLAPYVTGDGTASVRALIAAHNRALAAGTAAFRARTEVTIDDEVMRTLSRAGRSLDTVPSAGERVDLRMLPVGALGGYVEEVTRSVHPDTLAVFRRLAAVMNLSLAAIDFRAAAIERPWHAQRFAILEANVRPGIADVDADRVARAIVAAEFPEPAVARLPRTLVIDRGAREDADALWRAAASAAPDAAFAGAAGLHVGGLRLLAPPVSPRRALDRAAEDPTVGRIVLWLHPADIEADGLGIRHIDEAFLPSAPNSGTEAAVCELVRHHARRVVPLPEGPAALRAKAVLG